jgi:hypothetical protein
LKYCLKQLVLAGFFDIVKTIRICLNFLLKFYQSESLTVEGHAQDEFALRRSLLNPVVHRKVLETKIKFIF